jgi:hypothetical protein
MEVDLSWFDWLGATRLFFFYFFLEAGTAGCAKGGLVAAERGWGGAVDEGMRGSL